MAATHERWTPGTSGRDRGRGALSLIQLAAGWHGIGQLSAGWALGAILAVLLAAAVGAWWVEARDRRRR